MGSNNKLLSTKGALFLSIFGGATVKFSEDRLLKGKRKPLAILAYIALSQQTSVTREYLAGLLWGDSSDRQARASLRQALLEIRRALAPYDPQLLDFESDFLTLDSQSMRVDAIELMGELEDGIVPESLVANPNIADTILQGFDNLSPDYNQWLLEYRSRYHNRLMLCLRKKYESDALPRKERRCFAETAIHLDPLQEEAYQVSMQLAAEEGDVGTALQTYSKLFDVLDQSLGMEPSARTQDLAVKIKTGHFDQTDVTDVGPSGGLQASTDASILRTTDAAVPTVAVLPFQVLGPDSVPEFFCRGILEDTVCMLARLREPRVISSNSTWYLDPINDQPRQLVNALGADYFVSGTIRKADHRCLLSIQLTDTASGVVEWARIYDTSDDELFDVQVDLARNIARKLVPSLNSAELRRARGFHPKDLSAYHLTLVARDLVFRLDRTTFHEAGGMLKLAAEKDPYFAPTFLALADWHSVCLGQGWSTNPDEDRQLIERMARIAIRLSDDDGRALAMLGHNQAILHHKYDEAQILFAQALQHSPNDAETLLWSSPTLSFVGKHELAIKRAEDAISLSPSDPFLFRYEHFLSIGHYAAKDYTAAAYWGVSSAQRNPHYTSNLRMTSASLAAVGKLDDAKHFAQEMMVLDPDFRVGKFIANQPFHGDVGKLYGGHLMKAGLPK